LPAVIWVPATTESDTPVSTVVIIAADRQLAAAISLVGSCNMQLRIGSDVVSRKETGVWNQSVSCRSARPFGLSVDSLIIKPGCFIAMKFCWMVFFPDRS
jgi:hypothetical protein